jgi:hypothetical protein
MTEPTKNVGLESDTESGSKGAALFYPVPGQAKPPFHGLSTLGLSTEAIRQGILSGTELRRATPSAYALTSGKVVMGLEIYSDETGVYVLRPSTLSTDGEHITGEDFTKSSLVRLTPSAVTLKYVPEDANIYFLLRHISDTGWNNPLFTPLLRKRILAWISACEKIGFTTDIRKASGTEDKGFKESMTLLAKRIAEAQDQASGQQSLDFGDPVMPSPVKSTTRH